MKSMVPMQVQLSMPVASENDYLVMLTANGNLNIWTAERMASYGPDSE